MEIRPGVEIGRYTIDSEIGRGGMGMVLLATDRVLERQVALKILLPGLLTKEEIVARFFREARLAARLTHPNTVHIYDLGEHEDVLFIAMEYVEGKPLTAYLGDAHHPGDRRMRWMVDVARGLGAAHARGLLHRDVKPSNVMVSCDGVAKVVDFGLAKKQETTPELRASFQTAQGFVVGTPAFMAPEQIEAIEVDARADQFSWALTTYALLLGRNLRAQDPLLFGPIPLLSDRVPGISRRTAEIVLRALSSDREMRFPSMAALLGELEPALAATSPSGSKAAKVDTAPPTQPMPQAMQKFASAPPSRKFCPDCGLPVALSSPRCESPHAQAFPRPPGLVEEPTE